MVGAAGGNTLPDALANWDGQWYARIVAHGYPDRLSYDDAGSVQDSEWAFFPLYPALVRLVTLFGLDFRWAAPTVSLLLAAVAMVVLHREVGRVYGTFSAHLTVAITCSVPSALTWGAAYTESAALLFIVLFLRALRRERAGQVLWWCLLLSLTRPIALVPAAVIGIWWIVRWWQRKQVSFPRRARLVWSATAVAVAALYGAWPLCVGIALGEPDAYLQAQSAWTGTEGVGAWPSWLRSALLDLEPGAMIVVALVLILVVIVVRASHAMPWGNRAWFALYPAYILATGLPAINLLRYLGLAVLPGVPLPPALRRPPRGVQILAVMLIMLVGAWLQRWWITTVWVPTSGNLFP